MKKITKKTAFIIAIILILIGGLILYFWTMPKFEKGINKFNNYENYSYRVNLSSNTIINEEKYNVSSLIEFKVDNNKKFTEGSFVNNYDDLETKQKFLINYNNNVYDFYEEKLASWTKIMNLENNFSNKLIEQLKTINNLKVLFRDYSFNNVTYKTFINSDKVFELLSNYNYFIGIDKEDLVEDNYEFRVSLDRKGNIKSIIIFLKDNLKLNKDTKTSNAVFQINFEKQNKTGIDEDLIKFVREENNVKPIAKTNDNQSDIPKLKSIEVINLKEEYKTGDVISFKTIWTIDIYSKRGKTINSFSAPVLKIKIGDGWVKKAKFNSAQANEIIYEYKIANNDLGKLNLIDYDGSVYSKNKTMSVILEENKKLKESIIINNENIIVPEDEKPIITTPVIPNKKMTPEEMLELISNTKNFITGFDKALPEVVGQLKEKLNSYDLKSLSLKDLISFGTKIKTVFGEMDVPKMINNEFVTVDRVYTSSNEFANLTVYSNGDNKNGPILTAPATLHKDGKDIDVYVVSLGGTEFVDGQATDVLTDILSGLEFNNDYLKAALTAISKIPQKEGNEKVKLIINGISLGGMVAQQVAANINSSQLANNFEILYVVSYGSPIISPIKRYNNKIAITNVRRLCDKNDIVPILSISNNVENNEFFKDEKQIEDGNYKTFISAHTFGYIEKGTWKDYDVLGVKNGDATITVHFGKNAKYHDALLSK